ncbi:MAG: hypothetical protein VX278_00510 [Myxococcota bacterium]|nr:hypothetical protein [Myxococcota bacterium]
MTQPKTTHSKQPSKTPKEAVAPVLTTQTSAEKTPKTSTPALAWSNRKWTFQGKQRIIRYKDIAQLSPCHYRIRAKHLETLSHQGLQKAGLDAHSPVVVLEKGIPLQSLSSGKISKDECRGESIFQSQNVFFNPTQKDISTTEYQLALTQDLPVLVDGKSSWWLYSRYTMTTRIPKTASQVGKSVAIQVRLRIIGTPTPHPPTLVAHKDKMILEQKGQYYHGNLTLTIPNRAWNISLSAHRKSPVLLVEELIVQEDGLQHNLLSHLESASP